MTSILNRYQITICYNTINKAGIVIEPPKLMTKHFDRLDQCKQYEWHFYKPHRKVLWVSIKRYVASWDGFF